MLSLCFISLTLLVRFICPKKNVKSATIMKFTPPAKSVNLSRWNIAAIRKNINWITSIVIPEIAKWSESKMFTAILHKFSFFLFSRSVHESLSWTVFPAVALTSNIQKRVFMSLFIFKHKLIYVGEFFFHSLQTFRFCFFAVIARNFHFTFSQARLRSQKKNLNNLLETHKKRSFFLDEPIMLLAFDDFMLELWWLVNLSLKL